jgi:CRP-like cAMP-binding protein
MTGILLFSMQASELFGDSSAFVSKRLLESSVLDSFDRFAPCRLSKSLFQSLVSALFESVAADQLSRSQFDVVFNIVKSKMSHGEPALARLVGKSSIDISDEWIFSVKAEYFAPPVLSFSSRTRLFQKGDTADSCLVVVKGSVVGLDEKGAVCWLWGENDVIGLDEMLLKQKTRSFSAWIEPSYGADPFLTQPLFLRVAASAFDALEARDFLHFLSGALFARQSFGQPPAKQVEPVRHPKAIDSLASQFVLEGAVVIERGAEVHSVFYICEGRLEDSHGRRFEAGMIVCLPEFLSSDGKVAQSSVTAKTSSVSF